MADNVQINNTFLCLPNAARASGAEGRDEEASVVSFCTWRHATWGYHRNQFSSVNTLHERELCKTSRTTEESSILVYGVYSESIDDICMLIREKDTIYDWLFVRTVRGRWLLTSVSTFSFDNAYDWKRDTGEMRESQ